MSEKELHSESSFSAVETQTFEFSAENLVESSNELESQPDIKLASSTCELVEIFYNGQSNPIFVFKHPAGIAFYSRMVVRALQKAVNGKTRYSVRLR